jgi:hypothetical protein
MELHQLAIAERVFVLASPEEAKRARVALVDAVRSGGGFVDLELLGNRLISVLISPGVVTYLEVVETQEDDPGDETEWTSLHDWDYLA